MVSGATTLCVGSKPPCLSDAESFESTVPRLRRKTIGASRCATLRATSSLMPPRAR